MKKQLLILFFWAGFLNAQTYPNAQFGTVTVKSNTTSDNATYLSVQETDGKINKTLMSNFAKKTYVDNTDALKENTSNKSDSYTASSSTTYTTTKALVDGLNSINLQKSYNVLPQITTSTALGALTVKRGSAADTDNILVGKNGAGTNTFSVAGNGNIVGGTYNGYTPENVSNKSDSYTASSSTTYASTKALVDGLAIKQNTLTNPITGTGTANFIPRFSSTLGLTSGTIRDDGSSVAVNGSPASNVTFLINSNQAKQYAISVSGNYAQSQSTALGSFGTILSTVTDYSGFRSSPSTQATSFVLGKIKHFAAEVTNFGAGSSVTTQVGFSVSSTMTGAVNNFGFNGDLPAGSGNFNLYMSGSAKNFLAGKLGIGTLADNSHLLEVEGTSQFNNYVYLNYVPPLGTVIAGTEILTRNTATNQIEKLPNYVIRPYRIYTCMMTQSGTSSPTASVLENSIGNIVWTRSAAGTYTGTLSGAFTNFKTLISARFAGNTSTTPLYIYGDRLSDNDVTIKTYTGTTLTDGMMTNAVIEIKVYYN